MKNRKIIIGIGVFVLIVLAGVAFFLLSSNKDSSKQVAEEQGLEVEEKVNVILAEDIGLVLTKNINNAKVIMEISNTDDILSLDYELSYIAKGDIPRGVIGHIENKSSGKPIKQEIVLGTCSDVCHYDEDVTNITLLLKVVKKDNAVYSVEKSLD